MRLITLILIFGAMLGVCFGQQNAPFKYSHCPSPAICCVVPAPRETQPVPGGVPTTVVRSAVNLFGVHITNLNADAVFLQFFDTTKEPAAGAVPIGASSWEVATDRDIDVGVGGGGSGWAFNDGIMACCSTDHAHFSPVGGCGFLLQYY